MAGTYEIGTTEIRDVEVRRWPGEDFDPGSLASPHTRWTPGSMPFYREWAQLAYQAHRMGIYIELPPNGHDGTLMDVHTTKYEARAKELDSHIVINPLYSFSDWNRVLIDCLARHYDRSMKPEFARLPWTVGDALAFICSRLLCVWWSTPATRMTVHVALNEGIYSPYVIQINVQMAYKYPMDGHGAAREYLNALDCHFPEEHVFDKVLLGHVLEARTKEILLYPLEQALKYDGRVWQKYLDDCARIEAEPDEEEE